MGSCRSGKGPKIRFEVAGRQHGEFQVGERCLLGARPEHFHLGTGRVNAITATVSNVTYHGNIWHIEVEGAGDFLPPYAGNLDVMTAAATKVGEQLAKELVKEPAA